MYYHLLNLIENKLQSNPPNYNLYSANLLLLK